MADGTLLFALTLVWHRQETRQDQLKYKGRVLAGVIGITREVTASQHKAELMDTAPGIAPLLHALHFAAGKHRDQRRKGAEASPYINHLIEVAELLAREGEITEVVTLQAAILHDTLEDTQTTPQELEALFGPEVRQVVEEVTDNKQFPKAERKRLQIAHAPHLSVRAKMVKLADKISNVRSIIHTPPAEWSLERKREYLDWSERVVTGCRGSNAALERVYDEIVAEGRRILGS